MAKPRSRPKKGASLGNLDLDLGPIPEVQIEYRVKVPEGHLWSGHKARLIETYLRYFLLVTKHGTYIDAFAGPQLPEGGDTWTANLVLGLEPRWFTKFFLFEQDKRKFAEVLAAVESNRSRLDPRSSRRIFPKCGDSNRLIRQYLRSGDIPRTDAVFCLLDQHTFECHWSTVKALAAHKTKGTKVEILYFLANAWLDRAESAVKDQKILERWAPDGRLNELRDARRDRRCEIMKDAFRKDLGYRSAIAWPIHEKKGHRGHLMFYLIHASDHAAAPSLMARAYQRALGPRPTDAQVQMDLEMAGLLPNVAASSQ